MQVKCTVILANRPKIQDNVNPECPVKAQDFKLKMTIQHKVMVGQTSGFRDGFKHEVIG